MVAQELEIVQIILLEAVEVALEQPVKTHHLLLLEALVVMELHHQLQVLLYLGRVGVALEHGMEPVVQVGLVGVALAGGIQQPVKAGLLIQEVVRVLVDIVALIQVGVLAALVS
jgi:hypothetical protein